jgi:MFS family permease
MLGARGSNRSPRKAEGPAAGACVLLTRSRWSRHDGPVSAGLHGVLGNGTLARAQLSFGAAFSAEWAFTVGIGLVAFAEGGATAVAVVGVLRMLPAALLAPTLAGYADRVPRERVLFMSSFVRGIATLGCAPVLLMDGPVEVVYALAAVSTIAFTPYRASHSALLPSLCKTPDELTKVNVVRGALDGLSVVSGPFVAALLVGLGDVANIFVFSGLMGLLSAGLVLALDYERMVPEVEPRKSFAEDIRSGVRAVADHAGVPLTFWLVILQATIRGAFNVLIVVLAIDLLEGQESDVGVLQGAVGIGALVGSALWTRLVGSRAMTRWLGVAVVLWGLPLALMAATPWFAVALLAAGVIGIGNALVDVTAFTTLARLAPDPYLGRVFGLLESVGAIAVAVGGLVVPVLIELLGTEGAFFAVGFVAPVVVLVAWPKLRQTDAALTVRTDVIALLREVPMIRPLPVPVLEHLACHMETIELTPGQAVFEAGDLGDVFYVVESGQVEVVDQGRVVRVLGRGEGFGEIALLTDTPRTMSVRSAGPAVLNGVHRSDFVPAIMSFGDARSVAEATRAGYLSHAAGLPAQGPARLAREPELD